MTTDTLVLLAALALVFALLVLLLLRRPRVDLPPEWLARLRALEQTALATQIAVAKNDGALDGMGQQLRGFTQTTQTTLETLRHAVDERLAQAVSESRSSRAELLAAFGVFEGRLEQRLAAFDAALSQRQTALDVALGQRFDALQQAVAGR
ncbi:MAG: DNA recombination protein RmuC, partial [Acidovorax soli]|nr:DNA recombination protein RmuC [Acidovorax soli]